MKRLILYPKDRIRSQEGQLIVYPSSIPELLTIHPIPHGIRLTREQVNELKNYCMEWLGERTD